MAKGLLALLGKPKGGGSEDSGLPSMGGESEGEDEVASALGEMFSALKSGDNSGAALAFRRAYEACNDGGEPLGGMGLDDEEETDDLDM